jgi:hypothetical protein
LSTITFSSSQRACSVASRARSLTSFSATSLLHAHRGLALDDAALDLERLDPALAVLDLGRRGVLADRDAGAGGVEQAHRLVGQLARRDVAVRERDRGFDRLVEQLHAVVLLEHRGDAAQHQDRLLLARLGHLHDLEAPR